MDPRRLRPSPALLVALLALVVALGGTAVAAVGLARNSVRSQHIVNGQVKLADINAAARAAFTPLPARQQRLVGLTNGPTGAVPSDIVGQPAIALGADRVPVVAYFNDTLNDLEVVRCVGACGAGVPVTAASSGDVGQLPSITIGTDGLPLIAHYSAAGQVMNLTHCSVLDCTSSTTNPVDSGQGSGFSPTLTIGSDGLPVIAHQTASDLRVTHCGDLTCTPGAAVSTTIDRPGVAGLYPSIAIGTDGLPVIAHQSGGADLLVTHCSNRACTSSTTATADNRPVPVGAYTSLAIGVDGLPLIAHQILSDGTLAGADLRVTHCTTRTCSKAGSRTVETTGRVGYDPSVAIGADGRALIAHLDDTAGRLHVTRCRDIACTQVQVFTPDPAASSGAQPAIAIDGLGFPVVAHIANGDLRVTVLTPQGWGP